MVGLRRICDALTQLEPALISPAEKTEFASLLAILPELPKGEKDGKPILLPSTSWEKEYNLWELPELYAAWPYRLHSVTRPGTTQIARNTWDLLPDHNWGGSGMVGLQEMLIAADPYGDGKIHLLPAWPKEWDVSFKLYAPQETTVEAMVKNGRVTELRVTAEPRRRDVVIPAGFKN